MITNLFELRDHGTRGTRECVFETRECDFPRDITTIRKFLSEFGNCRLDEFLSKSQRFTWDKIATVNHNDWQFLTRRVFVEIPAIHIG